MPYLKRAAAIRARLSRPSDDSRERRSDAADERLLRERLASRRTIWSAGAYDALSAKMIEAAGFDALLTTGFGISASMLGQPDVELYTMTENLNVVRQVVAAVDIPVVADCDTGYGNAVNVMRTVREFEQAGVAALILEDQVVPKRCPAIASVVEVLPVNEGVAKIRAAVEAQGVTRTSSSSPAPTRRPRRSRSNGCAPMSPLGRIWCSLSPRPSRTPPC